MKWGSLPAHVQHAMTADGTVDTLVSPRRGLWVKAHVSPAGYVPLAWTDAINNSKKSGPPPGRALVSQVGGGARVHALLKFDRNSGQPVWGDRLLLEMENLQNTTASISPPGYPHSSEDLHRACMAFVPLLVAGSASSASKRGPGRDPHEQHHLDAMGLKAAVFSSISPWAELTMRACLHRYLHGVGPVGSSAAAPHRFTTRPRSASVDEAGHPKRVHGAGDERGHAAAHAEMGTPISLVTVDYNPPLIQGASKLARSMRSVHPAALASEFQRDTHLFDVAVAFSGLEHDGLGRYGDPINPNGDLAAMREIWLCMRRHGLLFFAVPTSARDALVFPANRIYGPRRLRMLLGAANFTLLGRVWDGVVVQGGMDRADEPPTLWQPSVHAWTFQQVLVLRRES